MAIKDSILSGSLFFRQAGSVLARLDAAQDIMQVSGALHISGANLLLNGSNIGNRITILENSNTGSLIFGNLLLWTGSTDYRLDAIELHTGSVNTFTGSYNTGSFSGSFTGDGSNLTGVVSSSFALTASTVEYTDINNIPSGIISRSAQITALGFISESGGSSGITGSSLVTASAAGSIITFTKGDASTFNISIDTADSASIISRLDSLETETGSISTEQTLQDSRLQSLETKTGSLESTDTLYDSRLDSLETKTGSLDTEQTLQDSRLQSLETETGSISTEQTLQDARLDAIEAATGSLTDSGITGSSLVTASAAGSTITFTKGDASTFDVVISTATADSASHFAEGLVTASNDFSQITFTKDNGDTFTLDATGNHIHELVKNKESQTLVKGTPVYVSGSTGNASHIYVASASRADRMPAAYVLDEDLTFDQEGYALLTGFINNVDTSQFAAGDSIYVGASGGYTNVKPTGSNFIQKLGNVIKVDAANGSGVITGAGRANDVPNIQENYLWIGNTDGVATPVSTGSLSGSFTLLSDFTSTSSSFSSRVTNLEGVDNLYDSRLDSLETKTGSLDTEQTLQDSRLTSLETETGSISTEQSLQDNRLQSLETKSGSLESTDTLYDGRLDSLETETGSISTEQTLQDSRLQSLETKTGSLESTDTLYDGRLDAIEAATSSYALEANISGAFSAPSSSFSTRITDLEGVDTLYDGRLDALELETGSISTEQTLQDSRLQSLETKSGSLESTDTLYGSRLQSLETKSGSLESTDTLYGSRLQSLETKSGSLDNEQTLQDSRLQSLETKSGSLESTDTLYDGRLDAIEAATSSYLLNTTDTLTGDLTVTGKITAEEFHTEFVSSSIIYKSGSTKFGDTSDDIHQFTGSLSILSGSISLRDDADNIVIGEGASAETPTQKNSTLNVVIGGNAGNPNDLSVAKTGNVVIGDSAKMPRGGSNVLVGRSTMASSGTSLAQSNVAIGAYAMQSQNGASENVAIGASAGTTLSSGDGNILLGNLARTSAGTDNYNIVIGHATIGKGTNTTYIGKSGTTTHTYLEGLITGSSLEIGGDITGSAGLFSGDVSANDFVTTSDRRLKSEITPITEGLQTLKQFISYEYIKSDRQDAGFIAQEVQQAIPYAIQSGSGGYLTMRDRPILAHMHKAIIELSERLDAIEHKLK